MSAVHLEVDGKLYPATDLDWVYYAPCGCVAGWMTVGSEYTTEQAWKRFNQGIDPAMSKRDQKLGARMQLFPRAALPELTRKCPHTPEWGVPERPALEGHTWLVNDGYGARLRDKAHLFCDETKRSVCGAHDNPYGQFTAFAASGHLPCANCVTDAARVLEGPAS